MRPLLCCWGHRACGGADSAPILKAAASLELLHTFAILHDDIMDNPTARRRRLPAHSRVAAEHAGSRGQSAGSFGVSVALLTGDLALVASDRLFMGSGFAPERLAEAWTPLSRMRLDAVAGQYLDLTLTGRELDKESAAGIARLKSGSYSVRGPLAIGATLAGAGTGARRALESFGQAAGEAFQLADDLSGIFGDPAVSGKDTEADLLQGKPTFLIALAAELATPELREAIGTAWGHPEASLPERQEARRAIMATGAPKRTTERIQRLTAEAKQAIENPASMGLEPEPCVALRRLADEIASQADALTTGLPYGEIR